MTSGTENTAIHTVIKNKISNVFNTLSKDSVKPIRNAVIAGITGIFLYSAAAATYLQHKNPEAAAALGKKEAGIAPTSGEQQKISAYEKQAGLFHIMPF